jgi:hypothetical protein
VQIPYSNENVIIIPSNDKGTGFLRNQYKENKRYMRGLLSKEEHDIIVSECSTIAAEIYSRKRKSDIKGVPIPMVYILALNTLMLFAYFFLIYYGVTLNKIGSRIAGYVCLGVSCFFTVLIGLYNFFRTLNVETNYEV